MKEVKAYRCEYCGKVYLRKGNCKKHEHFCYHNPKNARPCYDCKYQSMEAIDSDCGIRVRETFYCSKKDIFMYPPLFVYEHENVSDEDYANNLGESPDCCAQMLKECKYFKNK